MEVTIVGEKHVLDTKLNPMFLLEKKYEMENNFIHILCNSSLGDIHCEGDWNRIFGLLAPRGCQDGTFSIVNCERFQLFGSRHQSAITSLYSTWNLLDWNWGGTSNSSLPTTVQENTTTTTSPPVTEASAPPEWDNTLTWGNALEQLKLLKSIGDGKESSKAW